jgi:hypothetical protein
MNDKALSIFLKYDEKDTNSILNFQLSIVNF